MPNGGLIGKESHIRKVASAVTTSFSTSGSLTSSGALRADILVVAGGGGAAKGGGGAGGFQNLTSQVMPGEDISITVGAGGTGIANGAQSGNSTGGHASSIGSLYISTGGGGGAGAAFLGLPNNRCISTINHLQLLLFTN